jgi:hypothetical protein
MDDLWLPAWLALGAIGIGTLVGARSGSFWGPGVAAVGSVFFGTWGVVYFTTPNDRAMFWPFFVIGIIQAAAAVVLVLTRPSGARSEPEAQSPSDGTGSAASSAE